MNSRSGQNSDSFESHIAVILVCWTALNVALLSILEELQAIPPRVLREFNPIEISHDQFQARLMRPKNQKELLPLIIFMHGAGERGNDNWQQLQHFAPQISSHQNREKFPCYVFAPQCPQAYSWNDFLPELDESIHRLIKTEMIDPNRVYLTGLSMGGFGTWHLAVHSPELFAAIAPVCGGGDPDQANKIAHIPAWVVHGIDDKSVTVHYSNTMVESIQRAGGNPIFSLLKETGHDSWIWLYNNPDFLKWLFAQTRPKKQ